VSSISALFRMRTSSIIYNNYIEKREGMGQPGQRLRNQNNVSEWSDMFTRGLLFQSASTIKIQLSVLVYNKSGHQSTFSAFRHDCILHFSLQYMNRWILLRESEWLLFNANSAIFQLLALKGNFAKKKLYFFPDV
jgi:hypothetical protein